MTSLSQKIAAWHDKWVKNAAYTVDSAMWGKDSTVYHELIEDVTPTPESDAEYWAGVQRILAEHQSTSE